VFYPDADRLVYAAPSGSRHDPLALHRRLVLASGGTLNDSLAVWGDPGAAEVDRAAAEDRVVAATRRAFDLKPFDADGGSTDAEVLALIRHFLEWLSKKG
jgi:hypothetical protein